MSSNLPATQPDQTVSQKFVARIEKQFVAEMGTAISWTPLQRTLAQHLYVKIDEALRNAELRRFKDSDPAFTWANVNQAKLAMDAVHRINLQLDALIPNHIHVIPYLNSKTKVYDLDLRIGYAGQLYCHMQFGVDSPVNVRIELVHEGDVYDAEEFRSSRGERGFKKLNPFQPGEVIGGLAYITYDDPRKDKLIEVEYREFEKAMKASKTVEFWGGEQTKWEKNPETGRNEKVNAGFDEKFRKEMQLKTVIIRVANKNPLDPEKVNMAAWNAAIASELDAIEADVRAEAGQKANGEVITMQPIAAESVSRNTEVVTLAAPGEVAIEPDDADEREQRMVEELGSAVKVETPTPEPPAPATAAQAPEPDKETPPAPKPQETARGVPLSLTEDQKTEMKERLAKLDPAKVEDAGYKKSPALFMAKLKQEGVTSWDDIKAILLAIEKEPE